MSFETFWQAIKHRVESTLDSALPLTHPLSEAMRYSVLGAGKRLRALLVYATAEALHSKQSVYSDNAAAAVECIHAYSLIHDDLPAMDDDPLRRGKPTCHIAFGEAMAILAGDALQTLAFGLLADTQDPKIATQAVRILAKRSGQSGMVLGQAKDILAEGQAITVDQLRSIHGDKTGALILACVELGLLAGTPTPNPAQEKALIHYGESLGLLFQVQDDILDVEGNSATMGKATQKDSALQKATYPGLLGLDSAKKMRDTLLETALQALASIQLQNSVLADIARMAAQRTN